MMATFRQARQIDQEELAKTREEREPLDSGTTGDTQDLPESVSLDDSSVTLSGGENAVDGGQVETVEIGMGKPSVESVEIGVTPRAPIERVAIGITLEEIDKA